MNAYLLAVTILCPVLVGTKEILCYCSLLVSRNCKVCLIYNKHHQVSVSLLVLFGPHLS